MLSFSFFYLSWFHFYCSFVFNFFFQLHFRFLLFSSFFCFSPSVFSCCIHFLLFLLSSFIYCFYHISFSTNFTFFLDFLFGVSFLYCSCLCLYSSILLSSYFTALPCFCLPAHRFLISLFYTKFFISFIFCSLFKSFFLFLFLFANLRRQLWQNIIFTHIYFL